MFSISVEKTFHQKVEEVYTGNFVYPELGNPKIYSSEKIWRVQICNTYASQRNCNTFSLLVKFLLCIWWLLFCSLIVKILCVELFEAIFTKIKLETLLSSPLC